MPRLESENPTPREIYQQVSADWRELTQLFGRQDYPNPPDLALVYRKTRLHRERDVFYLKLQPSGISPEKKAVIRELTLSGGVVAHTYAYRTEEHFIVLGASPYNDKFDETQVHEVTHSAVILKEGAIRCASTDELGKIKIPPWHTAWDYRTFQESWLSFEFDLDEFYPPLGGAHLLGEKYVPSSNYSLTAILPQLAGDILVDLYKRDIRALVREHPQIAFLSSEELWNRYVMPLLTETFKA